VAKTPSDNRECDATKAQRKTLLEWFDRLDFYERALLVILAPALHGSIGHSYWVLAQRKELLELHERLRFTERSVLMALARALLDSRLVAPANEHMFGGLSVQSDDGEIFQIY
jgi:hypothetical protein